MLEDFDKDGSNRIDFNEFKNVLLVSLAIINNFFQSELSESRKELVRRVYNSIKSGANVTLDDIARNYDPTGHPDVT